MEEKQEKRTFLRERFLRMLTAIWDSEAEFTLHNNRTTRAKFGSADVDILHFQVTDLETPLGIQPAALLRTGDIISFTVDVPRYSNGDK